MRLRKWASLVFFLSSYAPLAVIILLKDLDTSWRPKHVAILVVVCTIAIVSVALLWLGMRSIRQGSGVTVRSIATKSGELVNYTIPYMISFFGFDLGDRYAVTAFLFFLALMYWLTVCTHNVFINPVLALMGWSLYEVTFEENGGEHQATFLAKQEFRKGDVVLVQYVARFFYVVTDVKPEV